MRRKALGKGLDALLPTTAVSVEQIPIERIRPSSFQPRVRMDDAQLDELARSIVENGVLQPIVIRPVADGYELVAGERRWRATQRAGLARVPAIIQTLTDEKSLQIALVENIQRRDLTAIEEARAFQLLADQFRLTQEEIAARVSRSRSSVANTLRLLKLPRKIQEHVLSGALSMGHARALLPLNRAQQAQIAKLAVARGLSVRDVERRVQRLLQSPNKAQETRKDPNALDAEKRLEERFQTKVEIRSRGSKGTIQLHYHSAEELERLYSTLTQD